MILLTCFQALLSLSLDEYRCKDPNSKHDPSFWSISLFSRSDEPGAVSSGAGSLGGTTPSGGVSVDENSSESKGETSGPVEDEERESHSYIDSDEEDDSSVLIIHPEAIHAMFELIKYADNEGKWQKKPGVLKLSALKTAALVNVSERLLGNRKNIEIIWKHCCWLDWCLSFLDTDDKLAQDRPSALRTVPRVRGVNSPASSSSPSTSASPTARRMFFFFFEVSQFCLRYS